MDTGRWLLSRNGVIEREPPTYGLPARFCSSASREGVTAVPDDATAFSHRDANYLSIRSPCGKTRPTTSR
jgi:hypothetical protein